jgi:hypothetical protein
LIPTYADEDDGKEKEEDDCGFHSVILVGVRSGC